MPNSARRQAAPSSVSLSVVAPSLDCGKTPIKRVLGESVRVSTEIVAASPLLVGGAIYARPAGRKKWDRALLAAERSLPDRYSASFSVTSIGRWEYKVEAWVDRAATWRDELRRRWEGGQKDFSLELKEGNQRFSTNFVNVEEAMASDFEDRSQVNRSPVFPVEVDPLLAGFGAWYELFPRSFGGLAGVRGQLAKLADLGFDVIYFPPIHPIGLTNRKGPDNSLVAGPDDPGSPWAIGDASGGHEAVHANLGTIKELEVLVTEARALGLEIALDLAFQCSPDHPWLKEHPGWFRWREDGSIRFAENPPKLYEDIVSFDFESADWAELWQALLEVVQTWVRRGVRVFRVDNPHTKPLEFWRWLISEVRSRDPEVFFLAEAFTRPALMKALAKAGFSQSYTYFTWRNSRSELVEYLEELTGEMHGYFRPNFFVNTPDILSDYLQHGGPPAFAARAVLAATLSPTYGLYSGFEHYEGHALRRGSEEYLHSEKYELKNRALDGPLLSLIEKLNRIRRSSAVFRRLDNVRFLATRNDQLIGYSKGREEDGESFIVCVNLDPARTSEGLLEVPADLGLPAVFRAQDLLSGAQYEWVSGANYVRLDPGSAHILRVG